MLYYQPFIAEIKGEKKMLNMTVYEDSDPVVLAQEAGTLYGTRTPCLPDIAAPLPFHSLPLPSL